MVMHFLLSMKSIYRTDENVPVDAAIQCSTVPLPGPSRTESRPENPNWCGSVASLERACFCTYSRAITQHLTRNAHLTPHLTAYQAQIQASARSSHPSSRHGKRGRALLARGRESPDTLFYLVRSLFSTLQCDSQARSRDDGFSGSQVVYLSVTARRLRVPGGFSHCTAPFTTLHIALTCMSLSDSEWVLLRGEASPKIPTGPWRCSGSCLAMHDR